MNPMKKQLTHREIEELLAGVPTAEPPAGLAERIKAEIPSPLTLVAPPSEPGPEAGEERRAAQPANVVRPAQWSRWRPLLAAASLVAALGAGLFAYLNFSRLEPVAEPSLMDAKLQVAPPPAQGDRATAPPPAARRMPPPPSPAEPKPESGQAGGVAGGFVQPVEVPESLPEPGRVERQRRDQDAWARDGVETKDAGAVGSSPSYYEFEGTTETSAEEITITAESPLPDARKLAGAATAPKPDSQRAPGVAAKMVTKRETDVAGGVEGGVEGGVPGGVVGGVPGGVVGGVPGGTPGGIIAGVPSVEPPLRVGGEAAAAAPSTGGTAEPNDQAYGDVFFREYGVNPAIDTEDDRLSTFGLDVDTGSYTVVRRYLTDGNLPPREAIRVEEMVNFFDYGDPAPRRDDFALYAEAAPTPFARGERYRLVRFAVKAREVEARDRKPALLIFTVDVSGSMAQENRLELVKDSLAMLLDELGPHDRVGLVVYGTNGRVLLEPTGDLAAIRRAIEMLRAEGATNAEEGLALAYDLADRFFRPGAINRVILCSDGVANVGATGPESIGRRIEAAAGKGIELTTVGFGMGNYNDVLMEQLADRGDGSYAYVDDFEEARRIFVENLTGTLQTVAGDAKVQVEWNPDVVARWRLLGYENRDIADEKFRDDTVDAGEIGAGHAVTALYEIKLQPDVSSRALAATLSLRWRSKASGKVEETAKKLIVGDIASSFEEGSSALRLAAVAGELGEQLKGSYWAKDGTFGALLGRAQEVSAERAGRADVAELVNLIANAGRLSKATEPRGEDGDP